MRKLEAVPARASPMRELGAVSLPRVSPKLTHGADMQAALLHVQIPHIQRILFDELAPALDILAHQR